MNELEQNVWQRKHFDKYSIKDELEVELNTLPEEACIDREATAYE